MRECAGARLARAGRLIFDDVGWRFRRRKKLLPGVTLNLGKRGGSVSLGRRGSRLNIGRGGTTASVSLLGTGLSYVKRLGRRR
jgi:hypothetical protein